ncbi:MAG: phosphoribosyltransferase [Candidatus Thorarchaeota archaeon]|jgi:predicted phosphoribosyltransferase
MRTIPAAAPTPPINKMLVSLPPSGGGVVVVVVGDWRTAYVELMVKHDEEYRMHTYENRTEAGQILARELSKVTFKARPVVLAIPNGGIPVGVEIARFLNAELDSIIVRKLQVPGNPEAGFGALTSHGSMLLNERLVRRIGLNQRQIELVVKQTEGQIERRRADYEGLVGVCDPSDKDVILVDDGLASGYTMKAAIESVRTLEPNGITVAVPTSSGSAADLIGNEVDNLICPRIEYGFIFAVANAYRNWYDVTDREVIDILEDYRKE